VRRQRLVQGLQRRGPFAAAARHGQPLRHRRRRLSRTQTHGKARQQTATASTGEVWEVEEVEEAFTN
jgi:hypothetical protein